MTATSHDALRQELLAMAAEDRFVRAALADAGSLFGGFHPRKEAVHRRHAALLGRICLFEGRSQIYGTQLDWDEEGRLSPYPSIHDPERVDARRRAVGLDPLAEHLRRACARTVEEGESPPADFPAHRAAQNAWARRAGWRD